MKYLTLTLVLIIGIAIGTMTQESRAQVTDTHGMPGPGAQEASNPGGTSYKDPLSPEERAVYDAITIPLPTQEGMYSYSPGQRPGDISPIKLVQYLAKNCHE